MLVLFICQLSLIKEDLSPKKGKKSQGDDQSSSDQVEEDMNIA